MDFHNWISLFAFIEIIWISKCQIYAQDLGELCRGSSSEKSSCGQCIKIHRACSWCSDPAFDGEFRCDTEENLISSRCNQQLIYSPKTKLEKSLDRPIGGHTRLQPQQVIISMRPGETVTFQLHYMHGSADNRDALILNSETESQGLVLKYSSDCLGKPTEGRICGGLRPTDKVTFNVSVSLKQCVGAGDAVISIGVGGVRDVVGLYVTPVCGCECEKLEHHESRSQNCNGWGNLVCGSCICIDDRGGKHCECESSEDNCRATPTDSQVCSGRGSCDCGQCKCNAPDYYKGKFCECDLTSCPIYNGIMCAGHGQCECGKCMCESEWSGQICECHNAKDNCLTEDEKECSSNGVCKCNKCECSDGFEGELCDTESHYEDEKHTEEEEEHDTTLKEQTDVQRTTSATKKSSAKSHLHTGIRSKIVLVSLIVAATLRSVNL